MAIKTKPTQLQLNKCLTKIPYTGIGETELVTALGLSSLTDLRDRLALLLNQGEIRQDEDNPDWWYRIKEEDRVIDAEFDDHQNSAIDLERDERDPKPLTYREKEDLQRLERKVENGFYEAGVSLREIRDRALYRERFRDFEDYVKGRFGWSKRHAYRYITACNIVDELTKSDPMGHSSPLPSNERQCRPLANLTSDERVEAWTKAVTDNKGRIPTEAKVKAAVTEIARDRTLSKNLLQVGDVIKKNEGKLQEWWIVDEVSEFQCVGSNWKQGQQKFHYTEVVRLELDDAQKNSWAGYKILLQELYSETDKLTQENQQSTKAIIRAIALAIINGELSSLNSSILISISELIQGG